MTTNSARSASQPDVRTLGIGVVVGLLIALAFALRIRLVPESVFVDTGPRIALYVVLALSAPAIVLPLWALAPRVAADPPDFTWAAMAGH